MADQFYKNIISATAKEIDEEIRAQEQATNAYKQATAFILRMFANNKNKVFSNSECFKMVEEAIHKGRISTSISANILDHVLVTLAHEGYIKKGTNHDTYKYTHRTVE